MSSKHPSTLDYAHLKATVDEVRRRMTEDEDPADLASYRRAFRKLVPFFLRGWVAASMLRQLASQAQPRRRITGVTLFLSIGKNRRVYPRDLVQLLGAAAGVSKGEIGDIKVLDNYSFVEVDESVAPTAISKLDGQPYRGRTLTVNFAKKRGSEDKAEAESASS